MHKHWKWLLALSLAALLAPASLLAAEGDVLSGTIEAGAAAQDIKDDKSRVNEYSTIGKDDEVTAYGKVDVTAMGEKSAVSVKAEATGSEDQTYGIGIDVNRILRGQFSYDKFYHWLDHDKLDYINAGVPGANLFAANNPGAPVSIDANGVPTAGTSIWSLGTSPDEELNPNNVPGYLGTDGTNWYATNLSALPATIAGQPVTWQQIGRASALAEDFMPNADFGISRKEYKNNVDLSLPFLPNVTFHAGYRVEQREGMEQSIGMSKCTTCHVTGSGREVDEETKDLTLGATGKFGLLTVDYTYLDREFRENGANPTRVYDPALSPSPSATYTAANGTFDNRLLYDYEDGALPYDVTPDSDKESHVLKARVDLPSNTMVLASFVNAETESKKSGEAGIWDIGNNKLTTTYDAYGLKAATKFGKNLKVTLRAKLEEVENDEAELAFYPMTTTAPGNLGGAVVVDPVTGAILATRESVITRDTATFGIDGVYRLARKTTLRLGYEFQAEDRDDLAYGETKTNTVDASVKTVLAKNLTARASYTYQNIDNPFQHVDAAGYIDPVTGLPYTNDPTANTIGSGPLYGTAYYDLRQTDLSNLPDSVHELKLASTWSPLPNFSATVSYRIKMEENSLDRSTWEQTTNSPGLSLWYAPSSKLNLTFAYNYLGQSTESKFCQGWYDG